MSADNYQNERYGRPGSRERSELVSFLMKRKLVADERSAKRGLVLASILCFAGSALVAWVFLVPHSTLAADPHYDYFQHRIVP